MRLTQKMIDAARATSAGKFVDCLIEREFKNPTIEQPIFLNGSIIEQLWKAMIGAKEDAPRDKLPNMAGKLYLEVWNSSENRQEKHYFIKDGESHAYQNADYLFGYNPQLVSEETAEKMLLLIQAQYGDTASS
jgi:hypothetical protein